MTDILSTVLISLGTAMAGSFSGWFFGRKRQNIENIDMALNTWQKVIGQLEGRVDSLLEKVDKLQTENGQLKEEIIQLRSEITEGKRTQKKLDQLEKKIQRYEKILSDNNIEY